jgi:hypothetical protein
MYRSRVETNKYSRDLMQGSATSNTSSLSNTMLANVDLPLVSCYIESWILVNEVKEQTTTNDFVSCVFYCEVVRNDDGA